MINLISIKQAIPSRTKSEHQCRPPTESGSTPRPTFNSRISSLTGFRKTLCIAGAAALTACGGGGDTDSGTHVAASSATAPTAESTQLAATVESREMAQATQTQTPAINLALNKSISASSSEAGLSPTYAVDGNLSTRWSSLYSDAQWIKVDLGTIKAVNRVTLNWEAAYGKAYEIQTSTDGTTWKTVYSTSSGVGGTEDIKFNPVNARYVKMNGVKRARTWWGYSLYEFNVYSDNAVSANFALNKIVRSSSDASASLAAANAVDGSLTSRWSSQNGDAQWISVDLGTATAINHVVLNWETAYASSYEIQVSNDGVTWNTLFSTTSGAGGSEDVRFNTVSARYVKMNGIKRATIWGYSLFEFLVLNDSVQTAPAQAPASGTRDPLKQPFASNSIWNMPIGSGAVYVPANLSAAQSGGMPQIDDERIVFKPTAPLTAVNYSSAGWTGADRCSATGGQLLSVPMPTNYIIPNNIDNSAASFLMPDGRSIVQTQPIARCASGGPATALVTFPTVDIYGDGIKGAHGGSGMSAVGGSIRVGELRPGQQGPRHAIKVNVYAKQALYKCTTASSCYRWPATNGDGYAVGHYGTVGNNSNTAMKMGALLAIPASVNIANLGFETEPGRQLAWTLQNYGAYIVDDTWGSAFVFNTENGPDGSLRAQFQADYGTPLEIWSAGSTAWSRDVQRLIVALYVVNNNSASSIGGGGTPRQPLAPTIP
jgi:hypothetical protein